MTNCSKLKTLYETHVRDNRNTLSSFERKVEEIFTKDLDPKELSIQEIAMEFFGVNDVLHGNLKDKLYAANQYRYLAEVEGGQVLPSFAAAASGFSGVATGLLQAMVRDAYEHQPLVGRELCQVREVRAENAKLLQDAYDGDIQPNANLAPGVPLPGSGLKSNYIVREHSKRNGTAVEINELAIKFDLTDQIQSSAQNAGFGLRRWDEMNIIDLFLGIRNNYNFGFGDQPTSTTNNFYQTTNGSNPFDYTNKLSKNLVDWTDVNDAIITLMSNTDPNNGWEIDASGGTVLTMPQLYMQARTILRATNVFSGTQTGGSTNFPLSIRTSDNPVQEYQLRELPYLWYNRLVSAGGVAPTLAENYWLYTKPGKAVEVADVIPFRVQSAPISADMQRRGIVLCVLVDQVSCYQQVEPRYSLLSAPTTAGPAGTFSMLGSLAGLKAGDYEKWAG